MILQLGSIVNSVIEIADPFPAEGGFSIRLGANQFIPSVDISPAQFSRIGPQLLDLEARALIYFSVDTGGSTQDPRLSSAVAWGGHVQSSRPAVLSLGAASTTVTLAGYGMQQGQTIAKLTVGTGAGSVNYRSRSTGVSQNPLTVTHVKPGASHALTVNASDFTNIVVTLATNSSGVITSTAAQVIAAVNADGNAKFLVIAEVNSAGTAQASVKAHLAGGKGPYMSVTFNGYDQSGNFDINTVSFVDAITVVLSQHDVTGQGMLAGNVAYLEINVDLTTVMRIPFTITA